MLNKQPASLPNPYPRARRINDALAYVSAGLFLMALCKPQLAAANDSGTNGIDATNALEFAPSWSRVDCLGAPYSVVFRNSGLRIMRLADCVVRQIRTTQPPYFGFGTPCWSENAEFLYDFESEVIELDTRTGAVRELTHFGKSKGWWAEKGWPGRIVASAPNRFVHDTKRQRLVFGVEYPDQIMALDLHTLTLTPLLTGVATGTRITAWTLRTSDDQLFVSTFTSLFGCKHDGTVAASLMAPSSVIALSLSPDGLMVLAEMRNIEGDRGGPSKGAIILDADSLRVIDQLPDGHEFRWSHDAKRVAYLKGGYELWIYDSGKRESERIVKINLMSSAPDWSVDRYYAAPAWSWNDQCVIAGLSRWIRSYHDYEFFTVLMDLAHKKYQLIPQHLTYLAFAPTQDPFPFLDGQEEPD